MLLDHDHYMPEFVAIDKASRNDVTFAKTMTINRGSIVAMDRAYCDFQLFSQRIEQEIYFVTRLKSNILYRTIQVNKPPANRNILSDEWIKQNLKVKSFIGTGENALRIQIWTALIALLLFKWLHYLSQTQWSFSNLVSLLRLNLFLYRDLYDWLNDSFNDEPEDPVVRQLSLPLSGFGQQ